MKKEFSSIPNYFNSTRARRRKELGSRDVLIQSTIKYQEESRLVSIRKATPEEIEDMVAKASRHQTIGEEYERPAKRT